MKYIISRYNQDVEWVKEYSDDVVLYDRSDMPISPLPPYIKESTIVPNIGSDLYDKFTYIIDNYDNLPDVAVYTKANLFKYISKEEFDKLCNNTTFTPLLTQNHKTYMPVCYYQNGLYHEINNRWYLGAHPAKEADKLFRILGLEDKEDLAFAPGSNYIVPKENILKHSKEFYQMLRNFISYSRYPGEAQIIERALYYIWL